MLIGGLEQLKKEIKDLKKVQFYRLADQCERYFNMPLSKEHPNGSTTFMGMAIINLSLMYILTEEEKYYEEALRFIQTVCHYEVWGFAHLVNVDLSASWILFGLSLGYRWLKDKFDVASRKMVFDKLCLQSKIMYDYKIKTAGKGWSTAYYQNHNWINLTGIACCGYALKEEYAEAQAYIDLAKENFDLVYQLLADDGSNYEGVVYWRYGGMWLFVYADLLKNQEGIDYFKSCGYLKNTFDYRISQAAADLKRQLNFGDCHDRYSGHSAAVYFKIASEYQNGYSQALAQMVSTNFLYEEQFQSLVKPGILPEACFELLWYNPQVEAKDLNLLPKVHYFEDLGLISLRTGYQPDATVFSFKCGRPGGLKQWENGWRILNEKNYKILSLSHHHPDNLSFILNKEHSYFYIDEGYNRNIMPDHHNVLLVDGQLTDKMNVNDVYMASIEQRMAQHKEVNPVTDYYGEIQYFATDERVTFFKGENHRIYPLELKMKEVSRFVFTDNLSYFIMIDQFSSELEHTYTAIFNADSFPIRQGNQFRYHSLLETLDYQCFSETKLDYRTYQQEVKSVMTTQEPDKYCRTVLHTLAIDSEKTKNQTFVHTMSLDGKQQFELHQGVLKISKNKFFLFQNAFGFEFEADYLYVEIKNNQPTYLGIVEGTRVVYQKKVLFQENVKRSLILNLKR